MQIFVDSWWKFVKSDIKRDQVCREIRHRKTRSFKQKQSSEIEGNCIQELGEEEGLYTGKMRETAENQQLQTR